MEGGVKGAGGVSGALDVGKERGDGASRGEGEFVAAEYGPLACLESSECGGAEEGEGGEKLHRSGCW